MTKDLIIEILESRGIVSKEDISEFLSEKPKKTYDPFLLKNMEEAVELILDTVNKKKCICIYGDYDADGVTSISILSNVLKFLTNNFITVIPNRFRDGYGLNKDIIKKLYERGVDLILTVDCGITSISEVEFCKSLGLSIIITDHHTPEEKIPNCLVINPKQKGCNYPFKHLAGCGVAFKLAQAIQKKAGLDRNIILEILDIVALGTIGDIVPLVDENRTIVKYGLSRINKKRRYSIDSLIQKNGKNNKIDSNLVSFTIIPHINASGRIDSAEKSLGLFINAENKEKVDEVVDNLIELNDKRKSLQNALFEDCLKEYNRHYKDKKFPIIFMKEAHEGVTGIVAGKMKDYINKPVAIVTYDESGELLKGTSRGLDKTNLYDIISEGKDYLEKFGGHKGACGFSLREEHLKSFQDTIEDIMSDIEIENLDEIFYDIKIEPHHLTLDNIKNLEKLQPYGHMNPEPIFMIENCKIVNTQVVGKLQNHLKMSLNIAESIDIMGMVFDFKDKIKEDISIGNYITVVGKLSINTWNNTDSIQIYIERVI